MSLERLSALRGDKLLRIGLSATQNPIDAVASLLAGAAADGARASDVAIVRLSNPYFCVLLSSHSCLIVNNIRGCAVTHNPKVAGSNPAPATKNSFGFNGLS